VRSTAIAYLIVFKHDCERSATIALGWLVGYFSSHVVSVKVCLGLRCCIALLHHIWSPTCSTIDPSESSRMLVEFLVETKTDDCFPETYRTRQTPK